MQETRTKRSAREAWRPESSFRAFGECVIAERINKMLTYVKGVRRGTDPDAVHDMRVASRRLRAALDMFAPVFDGPIYERLRREVKQVTEALGRARDLDVMISGLEGDAANMPPGQRAVVAGMVRSCKGERLRNQGRVVQALDHLVEHDLVQMFERAAAQARQLDGQTTTDSPPGTAGHSQRRGSRGAGQSGKKRGDSSSPKQDDIPVESPGGDASSGGEGDTLP